MKKLVSIIVLISLLTVIGAVSAQDNTVVIEAEGGEVVLGFAAALTGEGLAPFGIDIRRGVELALEDRPSVVVDEVEFPIVLDSQDSLCSAEGGQTVANRFVSNEDMVAVVGPMCSGSAESAISIFDEAGFTTVSASATAAVLTNMDSTSFNRTVTSDAQQGVAAANFMFDVLGVTKIAIIHDGSTYGEGLVNVVETTFTELGGTVVARDAVAVGDTNFVALLENIASEEPELIYFGGFNAEGARLIEQRVDAALEDTIFMGADGIYGPELVELAGESSEGVYASRPIPVSSEAVDDFAALYEETYGETQLSAFSTNAYDGTNMLLDAIEAVAYVDDAGDLVVSREALADYVRSYESEGLTGALVCDGTGDCSTASIGFYQVIDGEYVLLDDAGEVVMEEAPEAVEVEATEEAEVEATAEAD